MPNKTVPGFTQVPVAAKDILSESHLKLVDDGSVTQVTVTYQVRDNGGVVRATGLQVSFQAGAYPTPAATLLAACNTKEGT
jgi:hypothetical protein